ncbi:MAG: BrnT family toxin [Gammaproteobacteria bacterium]
MRFEWDDKKNSRNGAKHGVSFETAVEVFDDPFHLSLLERHERGEQRWQTMGLLAGTVVLLVAHTYIESHGEEVVRIISARKATAHERKIYEENRKQAGG